MFINISSVVMLFLSNQWMRGAIPLRMIGWELTQNNKHNLHIQRKLNYFSSTSTINELDEASA